MIDAPTRLFLNEYFAHVLIRTGPRFDLPRLVQLLKGGSNYAASRQPG